MCREHFFCRSETISKVGKIKIMSASSPFFFSPLSPPFSFLSRVVSRLVGVQETQLEPVNTSLSDLLHSTANVKPHYPPLNGVPDPTFTNGHKAWSPWSTVVCRLTPSPLTFGRPRKALSRTASGTKRKSYGTVFSNLLRSQPEKDPFW